MGVDNIDQQLTDNKTD